LGIPQQFSAKKGLGAMENQEKDVQRLNKLESTLAYLQNDYDQLNAAVLENTSRLEQLKGLVERLTLRLESASSQAGAHERNAEDEKPPHY